MIVHRNIHRLKTWAPYFEDVKYGRKTFELRKDDRGYAVGDVLVLDEWKPTTKRYTNEPPIVRLIDYVLRDGADFGLKKGFVLLGLDKFANEAVVDLILELAPLRMSLPSGPLHSERSTEKK